jgi:hypothetical protein
MKGAPAETRPPPGAIDVWDFDLQDVGGEIPISHVRTLLYYLASASTKVVHSCELDSTRRQARVRVYGPVCEDGTPVYVELKVTASAKAALSDGNLGRLAPDEILLLRDEIEEHAVREHPLFPKGTSHGGAKRLLQVLGLPRD